MSSGTPKGTLLQVEGHWFKRLRDMKADVYRCTFPDLAMALS
jgi:hypothetical protein